MGVAIAWSPRAAAEDAAPAPPAPADAAASAPTESKLFDPDDGWLDASGFLDTAYGFVPIVSPITEPAVGYGAAGGLVFIDRNPPTKDGTPQRPDIAAVAGLGTENETWGAFGGWSASWLDGKLHTLVSGGYASVNLDFFGMGRSALNTKPISYNVEPLGGMAEGRYQILRVPLYAGVRYAYAKADVSFEHDLLPAGVKPRELDSQIGGLTPLLVYDTRNNVFTPTEGFDVEADAGIHSRAFGGDFEYQNPSLTGM